MTTNYYMGVARGSDLKDSAITVGTSSTSTLDVEVRMQIVAGSTATNLTTMDVNTALCRLLKYLNSNGLKHAGATLPIEHVAG